MPNSPFVRDPQQVAETGTHGINYQALLAGLSSRVPFEHACVITSLPRGSLQIIQPQDVSDALMKSYRGCHFEDRLSWEAMVRQQAVRAMDCWPQGQVESSPYFVNCLQPLGLQYVMSAPLAAPVLDGYAGAITLFRTPEQGAFDGKQMIALMTFARELDEIIQRDREERRVTPQRERPLEHHPKARLFAFDSSLRLRLNERAFDALDARLKQNVLDRARQRFGQVNGKHTSADRVSLPDSRGDLWNFRVVAHKTYPALGEGPFVLFCMQPEPADWSLLRPSDFAADQELSRLIPAIDFMQREYSRGPTLQEIARTVHLSPFHFHRRFTELLGITPKHFLLDCQIERAKQELVARERELSEIAKACGFAHQSHFTSRFKQATGLTPTRWRRLALEQPRR